MLGGLVGFERGLHGRAAGLRTHMLVSIGAALTAVVGIGISVSMQAIIVNSDAARISAQVISGIGFLGAGTILLKKGNSQITGLTTAAGDRNARKGSRPHPYKKRDRMKISAPLFFFPGSALLFPPFFTFLKKM